PTGDLRRGPAKPGHEPDPGRVYSQIHRRIRAVEGRGGIGGVTVSFEFSESFARVRVGFTPDLPLAEFYGLEPSLFPEPPGNTDIGEIYVPQTEVQVGWSTVSFLFDPAAAGAEVGFSPALPLVEFYGLTAT